MGRVLIVLLDEDSLSEARERADEAARRDGDEINLVDGLRLDGRPTFRRMYFEGEDYREQWWVERGDNTYRLEFSSPLSRREESAELFVRIARTFDVL